MRWSYPNQIIVKSGCLDFIYFMKIEKEVFMDRIIKLAGVTYGPCQENIKNYACPAELGIDEYDLVREPDNPVDPNAVRVEINGIKFGYIPKEQVLEISSIMDNGHNIVAMFVSVNRSPFHDTVGLTVRIIERP